MSSLILFIFSLSQAAKQGNLSDLKSFPIMHFMHRSGFLKTLTSFHNNTEGVFWAILKECFVFIVNFYDDLKTI